MSPQTIFSSTIHLRDFVDTIAEDPSREDAPNYVEIQTDINIFEEDGFYSSNIDIDPIHTRIRAYLTREERDLYAPNTFFLFPRPLLRRSVPRGRPADHRPCPQLDEVRPRRKSISLSLTFQDTLVTSPTLTSTADTCRDSGVPW